MSLKSRYYLILSTILFFNYIILGCSVHKCNFYEKGLSKNEIVTIAIDKNSWRGVKSRTGIYSDIYIMGVDDYIIGVDDNECFDVDDNECYCSNKVRVNAERHKIILRFYEKVQFSFKSYYYKIWGNSALTADFKKAHSYLLKFEEKESVTANAPGEDPTFYIIRAWVEDSITGEVIGETFYYPPVKL